MQFRALTDLYLNTGVYVQAGQVFTAPAGYPPPTNGVDPLDPDAIQAYFNVGPRGMRDAEPYRAQFTNSARWSDLPVPPASTQWKPVDPKKPWLGYTLSGLGGNLGTYPAI
jgi:hypothetical protein